MISVQTRGSVAVIRMTHGKANTLDTALCRELVARLGDVVRGGHRAAVLTGHGGIFSAGVDLLRVRDGGSDYLAGFLLRMDGPGFDAMDVPGGASLPKLQFTVFVPTADFFAKLRISQASLDLQDKYGVSPDANGLERFITATRRQNFLVPPRRHRSFPLLGLA